MNRKGNRLGNRKTGKTDWIEKDTKKISRIEKRRRRSRAGHFVVNPCRTREDKGGQGRTASASESRLTHEKFKLE